jgi:hypothetical protein
LAYQLQVAAMGDPFALQVALSLLLLLTAWAVALLWFGSPAAMAFAALLALASLITFPSPP